MVQARTVGCRQRLRGGVYRRQVLGMTAGHVRINDEGPQVTAGDGRLSMGDIW